MTLVSGATLGRYEIRSLLGAGGMGEVYLAQDTQLKRPVALKLLPASLAHGHERLHRFEQEAYAASALNHPHILTILEIDEIDSHRFIAMEYVEGVTLREHLANGRLKIGEAVDFAIQIASALSAAQSAGIVHRDIKPENIMVRPDGYLKVLDFGLAKLTERAENTDTEAPTRALITNPGSVMGTANYMSPEQARGERIDGRTDVWSLGVVLYEMVTGRSPFAGPTSSHAIVSILEREPPPLREFVPDVPEALEWVVTKALTKNREDRYQTAREVLTDLRRIRQRLDPGAEIERTNPSDPGAWTTSAANALRATGEARAAATNASTFSSARHLVTEVGRHKRGIVFVLAILGVMIAGAVTWFKLKSSQYVRPFENMRLSRLSDIGTARSASISPDGRYVVHVVSEGDKVSLWIRQVAAASNLQIVPPIDARFVGQTFTPDGNFVYYVVYEKNRAISSVYRIGVLGGTPARITQDADSAVTFSPDGKQFAFLRQYPQQHQTTIFVANSDGSNERKLASRSMPGGRFPMGVSSWSPDGALIALPAAGLGVEGNYSTIVALEVSSGKETPLTSQRWAGVSAVAWTPGGRGLIVTGSEQQGLPAQVWHVAYPGGQVERVTNDLNSYYGVSLSADGSSMVTVQQDVNASVWTAPGGDAARATKLTSGKNEGYLGVAQAANGRVVYAAFSSGIAELWSADTNGGNRKQLTTGGGINMRPSVTADGLYVVYLALRAGLPHVWRMDIDGGNARQLTSGPAGEVSPTISRDGKSVVFQSRDDLKIWKVPIDGGAPAKINDNLSDQPSISPDGKLVVCYYREEQAQPFRIGIFSLADGSLVKSFDPPTQARIFEGRSLGWSKDGRLVLSIISLNGVSNIWAQPVDGGPPSVLTNFKTDQIFDFDWLAADGSLVMARGTVSSDVVLISNAK